MELHLPVVIGLMVAALVLAIGAKRAHVPYNVALVIGGMLISLSHVLPEAPHLEPEVVFLVSRRCSSRAASPPTSTRSAPTSSPSPSSPRWACWLRSARQAGSSTSR